jgi:UV DNA damage endonuclease
MTLENDDRIYTPADLLPVCASMGIPFVYDVHRHLCHHDTIDLVDLPVCWYELPITEEV